MVRKIISKNQEINDTDIVHFFYILSSFTFNSLKVYLNDVNKIQAIRDQLNSKNTKPYTICTYQIMNEKVI